MVEREYDVTIISPALLKLAGQHYQLDLEGVHGLSHWARVYQNGIFLASQEGVNRSVVELFSLFHDSQRISDGTDWDHGRRGAQLVMDLRRNLPITELETEVLLKACRLHTEAATDSDITIQCCFDADRLDLWRVGIRPLSTRLCSPLAQEQATITGTRTNSEKRIMPIQPFGLSFSLVKDCFLPRS